eukprot:11551428-Ditylum_brightwellii.AAC.1
MTKQCGKVAMMRDLLRVQNASLAVERSVATDNNVSRIWTITNVENITYTAALRRWRVFGGRRGIRSVETA